MKPYSQLNIGFTLSISGRCAFLAQPDSTWDVRMKSLWRPGFPPNMKEKSREPEALRDFFFCLSFRYHRVRYPHSALPM